MHNYVLSRLVLDALEADPISRLEKSWELLNLKYGNVLQALKNLLTRTNPQSYKNALKQIRRPCIPLFELILFDLFTLKDSEPSILNSGLYNISKLYKIAEVMTEPTRNSTLYVLKVVPEIIQFVEEEMEANQLSHEELMWQSENLER